MKARLLLATIPMLLATGCPKSPPKDDGADSGAADASISDAGPAIIDAAPSIRSPGDAGNVFAVTSTVKKRSDPLYPTLSLFEKLAVERGDQPEKAMKAADFYDKVTASGIKVTNRHQVAAAIVSAGYCEKADAEPSIDLTVCEFDDDASIVKGKAVMATFKLPKREIVTHKQSTVAINRLGETQADKDSAKKIADLARTF